MIYKPRPSRRERLPGRRKAVTVCIAAMCKEPDSDKYVIVTVSDLKITTGHYSADLVSLKTERLHKKWYGSLSGKIDQSVPVIRKIRGSLLENGYTVGEVADVCKKAYIEHQRELAYEKVLSPFDMTLDSFLKSRKKIGESQYERLWNAISSVSVGFNLLVAGIEKSGHAKIFTVSNPSEENPSFINFCDTTHFAAIGSGAYLAESVLYAYGQIGGDSLDQTVYRLIAAKFLAESASDVGEATHLRIIYQDGSVKRLDADFIHNEIRTHWDSFDKPKVSQKGLELIKRGLQEKMKTIFTPSASET